MSNVIIIGASHCCDRPLAGLEGEQRKVQWTFRRPETESAKRFPGGGTLT